MREREGQHDEGQPSRPSPSPEPDAEVKAWVAAPVPLVYGTGRVQSRVIWTWVVSDPGLLAVFKAVDDDARVQGYMRAAVLAICQAPIAGAVTQVYKDGHKTGPSGFFRLSAKPIFLSTWTDYGAPLVTDPASSAWSFLVGKAAEGQGFAGIVHFRSAYLSCNSRGEIPAISWEVQGRCYSASVGADADPADVMVDLVAEATKSLGAAWSVEVENGPDGLAQSGFRTWCKANDFRVSRVIAEQTPAADLIQELAEACHSDAFESDGKWKVYPRGASSLTAHGASYVPPSSAVTIDAHEHARVVTCRRRRFSDVFNAHAVRYQDRANDYAEVTQDFIDDGHAATYKVRRAPVLTSPWIKTVAHAYRIAQLRCRESIHCRNEYEFSARNVRWGLLEPGDLVSLSDDGKLLASAVTCRIERVEESQGGEFKITAREWPTMAIAVDLTPQALSAQLTGGDVWDLRNVDPTSLPAAQGNLVPNPDFATGDFANWRLGGHAADQTVVDGAATLSLTEAKYCAKWDFGAASGLYEAFTHRYAYSDPLAARDGVPVKPGEVYRMTVHARSGGSYSGTAELRAYFMYGDGSYNHSSQVVAVTLASGWATFEGAVAVPAQAVRMWGYFAVNGTAGQAYFTKLTCQRVGTADLVADGAVAEAHLTTGQANTANLWPNPTSEEAPPAGAPSTVTGSAEFALRHDAGSGAWAGSWVRRLVAAVGNTTLLEYDVPAVPGEIVAMEAYAKLVSGDGSGYVRVAAIKGDGSVLDYFEASAGGTGSWVKSGYWLRMPALTVKARLTLKLVADGSADTTVDFDGILARKADAAGYSLDSSAMGAVSALARSSASPLTSRIFYRGNDNPGLKGAGAPRLMDPAWARETAYLAGDAVVGDPNTAGSYPVKNYDDGTTADLAQRAYKVVTSGTSLSAADATAAAWSSATTYSVGQVVTNTNRSYASLQNGNLNHAPSGTDTDTAWWQFLGGVAGPVGTGSSIKDGSVVWSYVTTLAARERITITNEAPNGQLATGVYAYHFEIQILPRDYQCDNLDGLAYLKCDVYNATPTLVATYNVPINDRLYFNQSTDSVAGNVVRTHFTLLTSSSMGSGGGTGVFVGYMRITPYGTYGPGDARDFGPGASVGTSWARGVAAIGAPPGGGGGGGGDEGGGYCPAPDVPVLFGDGEERPAGTARAGDEVLTTPAAGGAPGRYLVTHVAWLHDSERVEVVLADGRAWTFSPGHPLMSGGRFVAVRDLHPGDRLDGPQPGEVAEVRPAPRGPVVRITVKDAASYVAGGILSHNAKPPIP